MADPEESFADQFARRDEDSQPGEDAAQQFIRLFKKHLWSDLVQGTSNDLFLPGHEQNLKRRIEEIVDARVAEDKIPIGRQLRLRLIESLLADIVRVEN